MLLRDLTIENYRSFDKYRLEGLARVNLLVGDNNCGKTSVLEATYLLTTPEPLESIATISEMRSEKWPKDSLESSQGNGLAPFVAGMFREHRLKPGNKFQFIANSNKRQFCATVENRSEGSGAIVLDEAKVSRNAKLRLDIDRKNGEYEVNRRVVMSESGGLFDHLWIGSSGFRPGNEISTDETPTVFLSLNELALGELSRRWGDAVIQGNKPHVIQFMRLLHPKIQDLDFLGNLTPALGRSGILMTLRNRRQPAYLSEFGDGTFRLLQIGIGISCVSRGAMFVDEIDTGLHYSRLADMWRMVIQTAIDLEVQVFATTHSLDCIRGLADAVRSDDRFANEVAIFKVDRRTDHAARYSGEELEIIVDQEIEVR